MSQYKRIETGKGNIGATIWYNTSKSTGRPYKSISVTIRECNKETNEWTEKSKVNYFEHELPHIARAVAGALQYCVSEGSDSRDDEKRVLQKQKEVRMTIASLQEALETLERIVPPYKPQAEQRAEMPALDHPVSFEDDDIPFN